MGLVNYTWMVLGLAVGFFAVAPVAPVAPVGGADMPVMISLLNSVSGLAVAASGFAIGNTMLVVGSDPEEAAMVLEAARNVVIVPRYGPAAARAQQPAADLADALAEQRGSRSGSPSIRWPVVCPDT